MKSLRPFVLAPLVLALVVAVGLAPTAQAEPAAVEEDWYVLLNGEDRMGYMHTTEATAENGDITTNQTTKIVMARGGTRLEIEVAQGFVESAEGEPIRASSSMSMGGLPMVTEVEFGEKAMKVSTGQAGRMQTTMKRPIEGDWLPPAAMGRYVEEQLEAGAETIKVSTVDVASGLQAVDMTMQVRGPEDVEVYGKVVPAIAWDATVSAMPGITMREYVDAEGKSIKSTIDLMPGMKITVLQADKALALSELTPAEMMAQTFVVPSRPIDRPRELRWAVYRLKTLDGQVISLPEVPMQWAQTQPDESVLLRTAVTSGDIKVRAKEWPRQPEPIDKDRYLKATPILNFEDTAVRDWLVPLQWVRLTGGEESVAEFLREEVHRKIKAKDLSVGFATASDVARTKQGDCTEHAVLLAALFRGAGIPSRCVSGLVYADQFAGHEGIFGYHMWTQAWIENEQPKGAFGDGAGGFGVSGGEWIDFDATLPDGVRFDATHIALSVSDMNDGFVGNDMAALIPLLGNLEIEVVETVYEED
ncbi:MAG: transglutaminase-like domain-containing protein [Planctomycetota bacterium]